MKRIQIDQVQPGMVLSKTVLNSDFIVILAENTVLTQAHITRLKFLDVDELYVKDAFEMNANETAAQFLLSRSNAFAGKYKTVLRVIENIFVNIDRDGHIPKEKINSLLRSSVIPMVHESGTMDYLYQLKNVNGSLYNHCLRVALLSGVLAKWSHLRKKQIEEVVQAGLLHDIGKMQLPKGLLERNIENFTSVEFEEYKLHPQKGYDMLLNEDIPQEIKYAVLQHHERNDGSGYPRRLTGRDIHPYAKIIAVVDLYEHLTMERPGFVRKTPFDALQEITKEMFSKLEPSYCMPFIENVQQSFLGSKVVLSDLREGVIAYYPKDYAALPFVKIKDNEVIDLNWTRDLHIVEYTPVNG